MYSFFQEITGTGIHVLFARCSSFSSRTGRLAASPGRRIHSRRRLLPLPFLIRVRSSVQVILTAALPPKPGGRGEGVPEPSKVVARAAWAMRPGMTISLPKALSWI